MSRSFLFMFRFISWQSWLLFLVFFSVHLDRWQANALNRVTTVFTASFPIHYSVIILSGALWNLAGLVTAVLQPTTEHSDLRVWGRWAKKYIILKVVRQEGIYGSESITPCILRRLGGSYTSLTFYTTRSSVFPVGNWTKLLGRLALSIVTMTTEFSWLQYHYSSVSTSVAKYFLK